MLNFFSNIKSFFVREEDALPADISHSNSKRTYAHLLSYLRSIVNFLVYYYTYEMAAEQINQANTRNEKVPYKLLLESQVYFDVAVIAWCRLFGSPKSNQTHWRNIFNDKCLRVACRSIGINKSNELKNQILNKTKMSKREFNHLWKAMLGYRNKYVAHHDLDEALNTEDRLKIKAVSLGIVEKPNLNQAKFVCLALYGVLYEISKFLASKGIVLQHYFPEEMEDDVCADLAGNTLHKKRWRK